MSDNKSIFSSEYQPKEQTQTAVRPGKPIAGTTGEKNLPPEMKVEQQQSTEFKIEAKLYGQNKPKRKIIRARISKDES